LNIPLVLEYNGSEAWVAKNWGRPLRYHDLAEKIENVCLRHAHLVVTISDVLRDELVSRGVEPNRIVTYPNCIDPAVFNPERFSASDTDDLRREHGIPHDAVVATFVGTFGQWHGVDVLARMIKQLVSEKRDWLQAHKVHFMLVGDGMKMAEVRAILADHSCSPFYTLTGLVAQQDAPRYLAASDILLSPHVQNPDGTRFFGSPTKLFEYMAMGKGIVASDLDQIGEVLKDSLRVSSLPGSPLNDDATSLAVLTSPGNVEELAMGLMFLIENPSCRRILGKNSRNKALTEYTWERHVAEILNKAEHLGERR
jgi:glycosyltransferase involved in cell wall biosynthesis